MSRLTLEREFECRPRRKLVLDWPAMMGTRTLRSNEPLAVELTAALKQGEVDRLRRLLAANPGLAHCVVENRKGGERTPLHLFADWSGHNSNAVEIVRTLTAARSSIGSSHNDTMALAGRMLAARQCVHRLIFFKV